MHEPDGAPATDRRVGARPGVTDRDDPRRHRFTIDQVAALPVLDARHHRDVADRLRVDPVRDERDRVDHVGPASRVAARAHRGVACADDQADAPGAVVRRQRDRRHRLVVLQRWAEQRRMRSVGGAEVTGVVDEPAVVALLVDRTGSDRGEPRRQRRTPTAGIDHEVGPVLGTVVGDHADDVRRGAVPASGEQAAHGRATPDVRPRCACRDPLDRRFDHRPATRERLVSIVAVAPPTTDLGGNALERVEPQRTVGVELRRDLREVPLRGWRGTAGGSSGACGAG